MEIRVHHQVGVTRDEARHGDPVGGDGQRPGVGHHDPLWDSGGPRGEEDVRRILWPERVAPALHLGHRFRRDPTEELGPTDRRLGGGPPGHDDGLEGRELYTGAGQHAQVIVAEEVGDGHEDSSLAPRQDVGRLWTLEPRIHGDQHPAGGEDPEHRDDPLGAVEGPDGDPVAGGHTRCDEGGGEVPGRLPQLPVRQGGVPIPKGHGPWVPTNGACQHRRDRRPRGHVRGLHLRWGAHGEPIENDALFTQKCYFQVVGSR